VSNPMNRAELAKKLTSMVPQLDAGEARRRVNLAYVNEAMGHSWSHLLKRWTLQTEASYSTGTLLVTNGSAAVVLTGGTWVASWSTSPSHRRIAIQGRTEPYDITVTGAATGTLDAPWIGADNAAATYVMWRDTYPLPADCGYAKLMALYDPVDNFRLLLLGQQTFLRYRGDYPALVNPPEILMMAAQSTEAPPRPLFQMYPASPTVRPYHGWYFRRPDFMTADADYPDWPHEFQDMIWLSATIDHYSSIRFSSPKYLDRLRPTYADLYAKMVKEMDGNAAIDIQIEDIATGHRRHGNGAWRPNVLGWSGTEMTRP
jgi:hypothetical protein